jgi:hypothetical protein
MLKPRAKLLETPSVSVWRAPATLKRSPSRLVTPKDASQRCAKAYIGSLFAQGIEIPAFWRPQSMRHGFDRRRILWSWRRRLEALRQGRMMRLTAHGDQWFDPCLLASLDIRHAEITGVRPQIPPHNSKPLSTRPSQTHNKALDVGITSALTSTT